ncbi:MAG: DUF2092 domain-containing protein [Halioglobus sp.]
MLMKKKVVVLLCAMMGSGLSLAQVATDSATPAAATESQQAANALLQRMATNLAGAQRFQVDMLASYDSVQADGQKIEFSEKRQISLERPSLLLSETHNSDGTADFLLFDGKSITVNNTQDKVYARAPQPGDIDATIKYFLGGLHMRLPLAVMLMSSFPQELEKRVIDISSVEETDILGEPTQHLAGRTQDVDFQVWITTDNRALPLRIVLTYRQAAGEPQFRANFSNWKFNPSFSQKMFQFEPQPGARELPFAASFTQESVTGTGTASPATSGEKP